MGTRSSSFLIQSRGELMLKTARMRKFRALVLQRTHDQVLAGLHEAGVVQLKEISELELTRKALSDELYEVSSLLGKLRDIQEFLGPPPRVRPKRIRELTYQETLKSARSLLEKLEPKVSMLKAEGKALGEGKQALLAQAEVLQELEEIKFPLKYIRPTKEIHVTTGRIAEEKVGGFIESARNSLSQKVFTTVLGKGKKRIVIVVCRVRDQPKLLPVLYRYEMEPLELPPIVGTPERALRVLRKKLAEVEKQEARFRRKVRKLAKRRSHEVACSVELLEIQRERLRGSAAFGYTDTTTLIEGWVPAKQVRKLDRLLNKTTRQQCIFRTYEPQPPEIEAVPIEFENPRSVRNFEYVTEMYGMPRYDEVDPTPLIAFTFPLFFAICVSDAGYGLLLGAFMASGVWFAKAFPRKFRMMMVISAALTVVIGALMGGWFGAGPKLWVNPLENPIPILKLAVFIGILHILLAFGIVAALKDAFRRDWRNLALDHIPRVLIVIGFFGLSFCALGIGLHEFGIDFTFPKMDLFEAFNPIAPATALVVTFRVLFYAGLGIGMAGAVLMGQGALEKLSGLINVVYGITGLVADAASYSRLMALGIATGIIAFAINFIVGFLYGGAENVLSPISPALVVLAAIPLGAVLFLAHCFNIFIQTLGAFVHTLRLHYVEFFGKFYEGGGEKFVPFKAKRTFTKIGRR